MSDYLIPFVPDCSARPFGSHPAGRLGPDRRGGLAQCWGRRDAGTSA